MTRSLTVRVCEPVKPSACGLNTAFWPAVSNVPLLSRSHAYESGSAAPATSNPLPLSVIGVSSNVKYGPPALAVGSTLFTVKLNVGDGRAAVLVARRDHDVRRGHVVGRVVRPAPRAAGVGHRADRGRESDRVGRDVAVRAAIGGRLRFVDRDRSGVDRERRRDVVDREVERGDGRAAVFVAGRDDDARRRRDRRRRVATSSTVPPLNTTLPIEAARVTVSAGTSPYVPLLVAVWPSLIVTDALATVSVGATLFTVRSNVAIVEPPSSSLAVITTLVVRPGHPCRCTTRSRRRR